MDRIPKRGFTIVELVIVIVIIVVVAMLSKPCINQASTRSMVSRARHDMRAIATGVEAYYATIGVTRQSAR